NAALVVLAATKQMPVDWPPARARVPSAYRMGATANPGHSVLPALTNVLPETALTDAQTAEVRAAMLKVSAALTTAQRLILLPRGRFPVDWQKQRFEEVLPYDQDIYRAADLLALATVWRAQEGS